MQGKVNEGITIFYVCGFSRTMVGLFIVFMVPTFLLITSSISWTLQLLLITGCKVFNSFIAKLILNKMAVSLNVSELAAFLLAFICKFQYCSGLGRIKETGMNNSHLRSIR